MGFKDGDTVEVFMGHPCWIGRKLVVGQNGWPYAVGRGAYCRTCQKNIAFPAQETTPFPHAVGAGLPTRWLAKLP